MDDAALESRLLKMEASIRQHLTSVVEPVGTEVAAIKLKLTTLEARMSDVARLEAELATERARREAEIMAERVKREALENEINSLKLWQASFTGEKVERDKAADKAATMWRNIAGGLLVALIVAIATAGIGMWAQSKTASDLTPEQVRQIVREAQREAPAPTTE